MATLAEQRKYLLEFYFLVSYPNLEETINLSNLTKIPVLISGGISTIKDVIDIKKKKLKNIEGIIVGKAIYDGSINIKELSKII